MQRLTKEKNEAFFPTYGWHWGINFDSFRGYFEDGQVETLLPLIFGIYNFVERTFGTRHPARRACSRLMARSAVRVVRS